MFRLSGLKKAPQVIMGVMCASIAFLLVQSEAAFAEHGMSTGTQ